MTDKKDVPDTEPEQQIAALEKELETQASSSERKPSADSAPSAKTRIMREQKNRNGQGFLWAVVIINFLLLAAGAGAGYWFWQQWHLQQQEQAQVIEQQKAAQTNQLRANNELQSSLQQDNETLRNRLLQLSKELSDLEAQSLANTQSLADVSGRRPSDWLLAEADYLVRMAGRKLWLEKDIRTAILMMQSADSRLQDLSDPSLLPVRELIAADIQTLQQINPVSLSSVALALSGMLPQVNNLPLALPEIPEIKSREDQTSESIGEWRANLDKLWVFFREELINYQPRTTAIKPMLTQQQQWLAKEQLKLALLQAQSAVLSEQETLFKQSLQRAIGLIVDHFELADTSVEKFVDSLRNLEQTNIHRELPSQMQSARPLQELLQRRVESAFSSTNKAIVL